MRLSEAIRLGCAYGPQIRGVYEQEMASHHASCALGAAALGSGWREGNERRDRLGSVLLWIMKHWPLTSNLIAQCPACLGSHQPGGTVSVIIVHLNDGHFWLREQIADWVESQEREYGNLLEPQPPAVPVPVNEEELVCV